MSEPGGGPGGRFMVSFGPKLPANQRRLRPGTIRRIAKFAIPYRKSMAAFLLLVVVDALSGAVNPLLFREVIDNGILKRSSTAVILFASLIAALAVTDSGLRLWQRWISAHISQSLVFDMRSHVFSHLQRMPIAFFTRAQTGALVSRLNNDVLGAQQAFTDTFSSVIGSIITVTFTLAAMFVLSWQITMLSLIMTPLFIFPTRWLAKRLAAIMRDFYNLSSQMNTTMTERFNVAGALLVKLFGSPGDEATEFRQKAAKVRDIGVTQAMSSAIYMTSLMLTASVSAALVFGLGGVLAVHGTLLVGTVVALAAYLNRLYGPLMSLSNMQVDVMAALVSFERVFEVLDLRPMIEEKPGAVAIPRGPATIQFDHVRFTYPAAGEISLASLEPAAGFDETPPQQVLFDVSFTASPGQLVALVGPSGAGKTTIGNLVPRLYDVQEGAVRVNGVDVRDATLQSLHAAVGVVTQDAYLFHDTIRFNLLYAKPDATESELTEALRAAQILAFVESLPDGLDTVVGDRGFRLSGGERQRIAIARLLLKSPNVVVLDEATAHLDSESETALQQALKSALADRTSLVIAHRLSTVRHADLILVMSEGRVAERGTHDDLIEAGGLYAELHRSQFARTPSQWFDGVLTVDAQPGVTPPDGARPRLDMR